MKTRFGTALWVGLALGALPCFPIHAQDAPTTAPASAQDAARAFVAAETARQGLVGVSVALVQNGKVTLAQAEGRASLTAKRPVTADTAFAIGSLTKQFTAACVLLLAEDGKLSLDDPVSKYFPPLTRAGDVTLLDLMNHVSGYRDFYPLDYLNGELAAATTPDAALKRYGTRPLDFAPGTRWSYSNTGYLILGRVVEKASGESLGAFLQRRIFGPLGMTHTGTTAPPDGARGCARFALGAPEAAPPEGAGWMLGSGDLWSTPSDLAKWDVALMDGKVLTPASRRLMTTARRLADGASTGYGGGLEIKTVRGGTVWTHTGEVSGFAALNALAPASHSALIVLTNSDYADTGPFARTLLYPLVPRAVGRSAGFTPDARPVVPAVAGPGAASVARALFLELQAGRVDRARLGPDFAAYLTPARVRAAAQTLSSLGAPRSVLVTGWDERGGMEVAWVQFTFAGQTLRALMFRTPDGQVQEFRLFRA